MNDDFLKNLSDEQKAQLKNCKSKEELLSFAMKSGQELSDEVLDYGLPDSAGHRAA